MTGFIDDGPRGMAKRHEVPGPAAAPGGDQPFLGKGDGVKTCPVTGSPIDPKVSAEILGRKVFFCCASR